MTTKNHLWAISYLSEAIAQLATASPLSDNYFPRDAIRKALAELDAADRAKERAVAAVVARVTA